MAALAYALCLTALGASMLAWRKCWSTLKAVRGERTRQEAVQHRLFERISHEIRNPLDVVSGMSSLLAHSPHVDINDRPHVLALREAALTLDAVARGASVILGNFPSSEMAPVQIQELLQQCLRQRQFRAAEHNIHLECHIEPGAPKEILGNAVWIRVVIESLVEHSISITSRGFVEITIQATADALLRVIVSDSGPAFCEQTLAHLFEPFGLHDRMAAGNPPGTGLNLHVAKLLAERMSGTLTASAGAPAGTIFSLTLPVQVLSRGDDNNQMGNVVALRDCYAQHRKEVPPQRLLLVEDQASNAHLITTTLKRGGHEVVLARNGDEALTHLKTEPNFDAVIVDLRLPGINGLDVMKLSRFYAPAKRHGIPFIVLTGEGSEKVRQECFAAGAWTFLQKPMSSWRLLDAVAFVVEQTGNLADSGSMHGSEISFGAAHRAALSADTSQTMENFRDILNYQRDIDRAAEQNDWTKVIQRLRAVRGAAYLMGASRVVTICGRLLDAPESSLSASWPSAQIELDARIDEAWRSLSALLSRGAEG